ncbi:MAG: hypothetical protein K5777_08740 [Nitrosopumilus sp.]|nr:hypothetical protein [Nitrosopumilus sp.]
MTSDEDISSMFSSESQKLKNLFDTTDSNFDMNIHEIIETYYHVMNVSSMATMLKQQAHSESKDLMNKIQETEKLISERFDSVIHPKIMEKLSTSIQELAQNLQSRNSTNKSKEETENDAKLFDELREKMSTKEFVEQYANGLSDD